MENTPATQNPIPGRYIEMLPGESTLADVGSPGSVVVMTNYRVISQSDGRRFFGLVSGNTVLYSTPLERITTIKSEVKRPSDWYLLFFWILFIPLVIWLFRRTPLLTIMTPDRDYEVPVRNLDVRTVDNFINALWRTIAQNRPHER